MLSRFAAKHLPFDFPSDGLTHIEITKLLALQRAGKLIVEGIKQRVWITSGVIYLSPEPMYLWSCAEIISRKRMVALLESL